VPFSNFLASNKPFNTPLAALTIHWALSVICMVLPPPGDVYVFMLSGKNLFHCLVYELTPLASFPVPSYSMALVNMLVSFGLLLLYTKSYKSWEWNPPYQAPKIAIVLFFLSNVFLVSVPLIPPPPGQSPYQHLPYFVRVFL
jgi:hypothetical protein